MKYRKEETEHKTKGKVYSVVKGKLRRTVFLRLGEQLVLFRASR
jgi:hypothetical protein